MRVEMNEEQALAAALQQGRANAMCAEDQQFTNAYESAEQCVWSYWQNVRDTLVDLGISRYEHEAIEMFWKSLPANLQQYR